MTQYIKHWSKTNEAQMIVWILECKHKSYDTDQVSNADMYRVGF